MMAKIKRFFIGLAVTIVIVIAVFGGAISDRLFGYKILDRFFPRLVGQDSSLKTVVKEESVVIDVVEKVGPSVVTIGIEKEESVSPLSVEFGPFGFSLPQAEQEPQKIEENIGTGFILTQDGLIVTNKHVVSNTEATYKIIDKDDKVYEVKKIYRDPTNDLAILQIEAVGLKPVELGDSDELKVGQFVIAIGTALGEFKETVTTGVISGLGRGITAGSPLEGYVERLDNVIQTDAAINPGNSGGPLLNSSGQVVGTSVAVAANGQNIGFAIPINIIKEAIDNFNQTGKFERPFLGIHYRMISRDVALMNDVPQGAYVVAVVEDSAAEKAGIKAGDIVIKFNGEDIKEELSKFISTKKIGDSIKLQIWRDGNESEVEAILEELKE
jgi:serine protease Do